MTTQTITNSTDRAQWLRDRKRFIGASEVASLMCENPWKSILDLWRDKVSDEVEWTDSFRMRIGRMAEPLVLRLAAEWLSEKSEMRWRIEANSDTVQRPDIPALAVTVDGWAYPEGAPADYEPIIVEAKTTSEVYESEWLEHGPPRHYWWQLQAQMLVHKRRYCYIAALFGMQRFEAWKVDADEQAQQQLHERLAYFYADLVKARETGNTEPPAWVVELADEEARRRYELERPRRSKLVALTDDTDRLLLELDAAKREKAAQERRIKALEARLLEALGDADTGMTPSGRKVSVKEVNLPERTLKATTFRRLYVGKAKKTK